MSEKPPIFSLLMPTYNDEHRIRESIQSCIDQTVAEWELIIVDDGSTDNTAAVVQQFSDSRIVYRYQENADQLNALLNGSTCVRGEYVMLIHSDDRLLDHRALERLHQAFVQNPEAQSFYADLVTMNQDSLVAGVLKTPASPKSYSLTKLFINRGSNRLGDHFCARAPFFAKKIVPDYVVDNTLYAFDYRAGTTVGVQKTDPWYCYRVSQENYINSDVGKYVILSGQIRTVFKFIQNSFSIRPLWCWRLLTVTYRTARRLSKRLHRIHRLMRVRNIESPDWAFAKVYFQYFSALCDAEPYPDIALAQLQQLQRSIAARMRTANTSPLDLTRDLIVPRYVGKDARRFYLDMQSGTCDEIYRRILHSQYDVIVVKDEADADACRQILRFFGFFFDVKYNEPKRGNAHASAARIRR